MSPTRRAVPAKVSPAGLSWLPELSNPAETGQSRAASKYGDVSLGAFQILTLIADALWERKFFPAQL